MRLFFIRHGETTGDIEDRYGGSYDDHLTERGRAQVRASAEELKDKGIQIIFTSPLVRARESADIIKEVVSAPVVVLDGLQERHYGVLTGLTKAEASLCYPDAVRLHADPNNTDPEGESRADFEARVRAAFAEIRASAHDTVLVVAHGGSLKVLLHEIGAPIPNTIGDGEIFAYTCVVN